VRFLAPRAPTDPGNPGDRYPGARSATTTRGHAGNTSKVVSH